MKPKISGHHISEALHEYRSGSTRFSVGSKKYKMTHDYFHKNRYLICQDFSFCYHTLYFDFEIENRPFHATFSKYLIYQYYYSSD